MRRSGTIMAYHACLGRGLLLTLSLVLPEGATAEQRPAPQVSGTVYGVVTDTAGTPTAGADVYIGVHYVADPEAPGACEAPPWQLLALVRTLTDASGMYRQEIPVPETLAATEEPPNCVVAYAEVRSGAPGSVSAGSTPKAAALPVKGVRLDLTLSPLPTTGQDEPLLGDEREVHVSRERVPGWAGMYLQGDTVVVHVARPDAEAAARAYALEALRTRCSPAPCPDPAPAAVEVRVVPYSFEELFEWSLRAVALASLKGFVFIDNDERTNRVVLGFEGPLEAERARRALATLDVPPEAIAIEAPEEAPPPRAPFGPKEPRLGIRLVPFANPTFQQWMPNGEEIVFLDGVSPTRVDIRAVDVAAREVRTLTEIELPQRQSGAQSLHVTSDGQWVYFSQDGNPPVLFDLYRVPATGGKPKRVADSLSVPPVFAVSAEGTELAYLLTLPGAPPMPRGGHLVIDDTGTGKRKTIPELEGTPEGPMAFSPSGRALLFLGGSASPFDPVGVWGVSVVEGHAKRLLSVARAVQWTSAVHDVRWEGDAPHLLVLDYDTAAARAVLYDLDAETGLREPLGEVPAAAVPFQAVWTQDGEVVALWAPVAIETCSKPGDCGAWDVPRTHWRLYVWHRASGEPKVVAEATTTAAPSWLALSPDGRHVGYALYGQLYTSPLP